MISIVGFLEVLAVPVGRSILGWVENAIETKKFDKFEWEQLGATVIRVGTLATFAYFGTNGFGINVDAFSTTAGAAVVDWIITKVTRKKDKVLPAQPPEVLPPLPSPS